MCLRRGIRRRCIMIIVNAVQRRFKIIYFRFEKKMRFHGKNINNFFFMKNIFFSESETNYYYYITYTIVFVYPLQFFPSTCSSA